MTHAHHSCPHAKLAYCKDCNVVWCRDCDAEFRPTATVWTTTGIDGLGSQLGYKTMTNAEAPVQMSGSALHRHEG
jgi:hypothetical protein